MASFWVQAAAPRPRTDDIGIKSAGIRVVGYDAKVETVVRPRIRPAIWAVVVIILFVLCTVGGMFAQITNQGGKHVAANSCMVWEDQNCDRGDQLIKGLTNSTNE
jgi:hypothetical protein